MIMHTNFQNKQTQINVDVSNQTTKNQTDHVLVNTNKKEVLQNISSRRGPNIDSEHFLQKVIIKNY